MFLHSPDRSGNPVIAIENFDEIASFLAMTDWNVQREIAPKKNAPNWSAFESISKKIIFSFLLQLEFSQLLQLPEQLSLQHEKFLLVQQQCCLDAKV